MKCRKCSHKYDDTLGIYGCPNCHAEGLPKTQAQRRQKADAKKRAQGFVRLQVWVTPEQKAEILKMLNNQKKVKI